MIATASYAAPLRRTPRSQPYTVGSTWVVVSGYPPVCVTAHYVTDPQNGTTHRVAAGTQLPAPSALALPARARCHRCRAWHDPRDLLDESLGWPWWCRACVAVGVTRCRAQHGRLPLVHEFWCPTCGTIKAQDGHTLPREVDGRRRHVCVDCRRAGWSRRRRCSACGRRRVRRGLLGRGPWVCEACRA